MGGKKREFELTLELGHRSAPLKSKSPNGYTHKWTVFVRGVNDSKIENCIQKVVFQLHDSFDNPHRHILSPPYEVTETGYAGFEIPIEIYFKNKERPNHLVYVHDLCLLKNKPNDATSVQKIKFIHPTKEFERLLQKSGAQPLKVPVKKERSDSPPAKKQKSSSIIPSKDMSKQSQSQPASNVQETLHSSSSSSNRHQAMHSQSQPPKTSSKQFIDVFGAPLLYHSNNPSSSTTPSTSTSTTTTTTSTYSSTTNSNLHTNNSLLTSQSTPIMSVATTKHSSASNHSSSSSSNNNVNYNNVGFKSERKDEHLFYLQSMQSKISCISDTDRLQRIVDIVEGAGEWYNVTPKKFEFDLKRLDRKTLVKIERCLQY